MSEAVDAALSYAVATPDSISSRIQWSFRQIRQKPQLAIPIAIVRAQTTSRTRLAVLKVKSHGSLSNQRGRLTSSLANGTTMTDKPIGIGWFKSKAAAFSSFVELVGSEERVLSLRLG